jgi:hypothetical protein
MERSQAECLAEGLFRDWLGDRAGGALFACRPDEAAAPFVRCPQHQFANGIVIASVGEAFPRDSISKSDFNAFHAASSGSGEIVTPTGHPASVSFASNSSSPLDPSALSRRGGQCFLSPALARGAITGSYCFRCASTWIQNPQIFEIQ